MASVTLSPQTEQAAKFDVKDLGLADTGKQRIEWAEREMPVLRSIRQRFEKEKPLTGVTASPACTSPPRQRT